ncbi:MAG: phosphate ABC transporter permease subunit PstC [Dehalococcoidia bacterium]|nr:phosphate ABC transporter permease subunit PstC [Dehalococcoidia bacterium]
MALNRRNRKASRLGDAVFSRLSLVASLAIIFILVNILVILIMQAWPTLSEFGASFLWTSDWNTMTDEYGALPAIYGTVVSSLLAILIAVPVSFGAAVFLTEIAPLWLRSTASFIIEMLAAIPSIIIGMWGVFVLVPIVRDPIQKWLGNAFGWMPIFQGNQLGFGFLAAGIMLALMIIPIITSMSRDVLRAVPQSQREAMLALGATRWETISKAVLPFGRSGLVSAVILGLGRALGETMVVAMVIGNVYSIRFSLFSPGSTIPSKIAGEFGETLPGTLQMSSLLGLALILFAITLIVNIIARLLVWRMSAVKMGRL